MVCNFKSQFTKTYKYINIVLNIFRQMIKENKYLFIQKRGQKRIQDLEGIFISILYKVKSGCQWRLLPVELFVNCSQITVYNYFVSWVNNGFFKDLWINTIKVYRKIHKIRFYRQSIDSTKIKCIKGGDNTGPNPTDRRRKGSSVHTLIDQKGIPLSAIITGANSSDSSQVENLINNMVIKNNVHKKRSSILLADAGYDTNDVRSFLRRNNYDAIIPYNKRNDKNNKRTKKLTKRQKKHYKFRINIENSYAHLKNHRTLALRYEVKSDHFMALIHIGFVFNIASKI